MHIYCIIVAARLASGNLSLSIAGLLILSLTTVIAITLIVTAAKAHKGDLAISINYTALIIIRYCLLIGSLCFWILLVAGCVFVILSMLLWVAVGFHVELQKSKVYNYYIKSLCTTFN